MLKSKEETVSAPNLRLHVGSGDKVIAGWVNIDLQAFPGVDIVADVTKGLDFSDAEAVFAEHFLEHLALNDAVIFLLEVHRVLMTDGLVRLSTPNLDWVWQTHYAVRADAEKKQQMALCMNRAFHGWGHKFIWNREMLAATLSACGFVEITWCEHGRSEHEVFNRLEQHETYEDVPELPHVLIVEAKKGPIQPARLDELRIQMHEYFLAHLDQ